MPEGGESTPLGFPKEDFHANQRVYTEGPVTP
jgi:hypothetical protein